MSGVATIEYVLGNEEDGVVSAFLKGKQNDEITSDDNSSTSVLSQLIYNRVTDCIFIFVIILFTLN
jgi:hypothetical protein